MSEVEQQLALLGGLATIRGELANNFDSQDAGIHFDILYTTKHVSRTISYLVELQADV